MAYCDAWCVWFDILFSFTLLLIGVHRESCIRNSISQLSLSYYFYQFLYCLGMAHTHSPVTHVHVIFNLNLANCQHFNQPYQIHTNYLGFHIDIILQLVHHIFFCFVSLRSLVLIWFWAPIFVHPDRERGRRRSRSKETNSEQVWNDEMLCL